MKCPLRREDRECVRRFLGLDKQTFLCAGIDRRPEVLGDIICLCIRSKDPCTGELGLAMDATMRLDEALEIGEVLNEAVKTFLLLHPAYNRMSYNQSNTFTYRPAECRCNE